MYRIATLTFLALGTLGCHGQPASQQKTVSDVMDESRVRQAATSESANVGKSQEFDSNLREAQDLEEILSLMTHAETLAFSGIGRNESGLGVTTYPQTTTAAETIEQIAALIRDSQFTFDPETTAFLQEVGTIDCEVYLQVRVDAKAYFRILTIKYLLTDDYSVYVATRYANTRNDNFVLRLNQILDEDAKLPNSR